MAKQILIKAVRVRGNEIPKVQGGLDGKLEIFKEGKDISLYLQSVAGYSLFYRIKFPNGTSEDLNTLIDNYLSQGPKLYSAISFLQPPNFKVIQDPFNPDIIPFQNISLYTPPVTPQETPEQIQQRRQEKAAQRTKENAELAREQQNLKVVEQSIPENQKAKGSAKFGPLILKLGLQIFNQFQPQIISYITDLGLKNADKLGADPKFLQDVLSGNIDPKILLDKCPPKEKLDQIIILRNKLTNSLNGIGTRLDSFNSSLNAILSTYNISLTLIETLDIASKVTSLAAKFVPAPPGIPGIVTSTLNDLLTTKLSTLYTTDGSPKLSKLKAIFDSAAMPLTITSGYIKTAVNLLSLLDIIIKLCDPNANLINVDDSLTSITKQLNVDNNDSTYKGFTFEIEEVPFSNNLIRKRALGLNKSGIKLIETQLSFTLDNQVLIEELKLIIDKGNLKAD